MFYPGRQIRILEYPNSHHRHAFSSLDSFSMGFNSPCCIGESPVVTRDSGRRGDGEYAVEAWDNVRDVAFGCAVSHGP